MSDLSNLILQVTFHHWNTYSYSPRVNTLISFSPDMGATPQPISYVPDAPNYFFDKDGNVINLLSQCKEIDGSDDLESALIEMLKDVKDIEGKPILDSKFSFTLPYAFQYAQAKNINVRKFNIHYADSLWMGLLEHKVRRRNWDPDIVNFTYSTNLSNIDLMLNSYLDQHINLINSNNYLLDIIDELALRRNEKVNVEDACDYFLNKPFRMLILAAEKGFNYIMENGYDEYKIHLHSTYVLSRPTRQEIPTVYSTRLFDNRFDAKSSTAYKMMCKRLEILPNLELFKEWHDYNFKRCSTHEDNLVNTISRISTGYDFTIANWNYFQQAVFELGCKQHTDEASSSVFKKWINNRR